MGDNLPTVDLGSGKTAISVDAGAEHTCAILNDGSVKCWGRNSGGELGLGASGSRGELPNQMGDNLPAVNLGTGKNAVAIAAGDHWSCALLNDSSVKCWGHNSRGQLGLGDVVNRGLSPNDMGDNLPALDFGTGKTAVVLSTSTTCVLLNDGQTKCWGDNESGQLGLGDTNHRGDGPFEMGDYLPAIDLGTGVTASGIHGMRTEPEHWWSCALLSGGRLKCWGRNDRWPARPGRYLDARRWAERDGRQPTLRGTLK